MKYSALSLGLSLLAIFQLTGPMDAWGRNIIVVSDLHMGVGKVGGEWDPTEDFRWPVAWEGFLKDVSQRLPNADLVLAGDVLDLWQPRAADVCVGKDADHGCTVAEMKKILESSLDAHRSEVKSLDDFAKIKGNCVYFLPGNHDSVIVVDQLWDQIRSRFSPPEVGCIKRSEDGFWEDESGKVVVEHGHQIGADTNAYKKWPQIVFDIDGVEYIERPWGEQFVQALFNAEEAQLPLVDNLTPHSAGVRYKIEDRGMMGSITDTAKFLRFNLLETSLRQKIQTLGRDKEGNPVWNLAQGRDLGYELYLGSLDPNDPFAKALKEGPGDSDWGELRAAFDAQAKTLSDDEVKTLCDQLAVRKYKTNCEDATLGAVVSSVFSREHITGKHVKDLSVKRPKMELFIYGHTHTFELKWPVEVDDTISVDVINTGAFQRLVDDEKLRGLAAKEGKEPIELLRKGSLEKLDACYTFAEIPDGAVKAAKLRAWIMKEDSTPGKLADPCGPGCPNSGAGCDE